MSSAADWITLAEAAELLAAANVHFAAATIGGWARKGKLSSIKLAVAAMSVAARSGRSSSRRAGERGPHPAGMFEDLA